MNPCTVERLENRDEGTLFGPGTQIILRAVDTGKEYVLTYEQIDQACDGVEHIELAEVAEAPANNDGTATDDAKPETAEQVELPDGEVADVTHDADAAAEVETELHGTADEVETELHADPEVPEGGAAGATDSQKPEEPVS